MEGVGWRGGEMKGEGYSNGWVEDEDGGMER